MSKNIGVLLGSFHKNESLEMLEEVHMFASEHDLIIVDEIWVPGSMEKPLALKALLSQNNVDGAVVAFWKAADHMSDKEVVAMMQLIGIGA